MERFDSVAGKKVASASQKFSEVNPVVIVGIECFENKVAIFVRLAFGIEFLLATKVDDNENQTSSRRTL